MLIKDLMSDLDLREFVVVELFDLEKWCDELKEIVLCGMILLELSDL